MLEARPSHVHFIGIGGSGMTPLAEHSHVRKIKISGSDSSNNKNVKYLASLGIDVSDHQSKLPDTVDLVVISSAIKDSNPEVDYAKKHSIKIIHRSDYLKWIIGQKKLIGVAGTHGKTSTTAVISHMLHECGLKPSAVIGGCRANSSSYIYSGDGDYFVAELDESDGTFEKFAPYLAILTNIDLDHLDFYKSFENIKAAFLRYLSQGDLDGKIIVNWDNPHSHELASEFSPSKRIAFGMRIGSDVRGLSIHSRDTTSTYKAVVERITVEGSIPLIGQYNFYNTLCALSVANAIDIPLDQAVSALSTYPGVDRRLKLMHNSTKISIYDDYAHNPGKIAACLKAVRESFINSHIVAIFEPHRYSRVQTMYNEYISCFKNIDQVTILPVFAAGEHCPASYDVNKFQQDIATNSQVSVAAKHNLDDVSNLYIESNKHTIYIFLGAGHSSSICHDFVELINDQEKKE